MPESTKKNCMYTLLISEILFTAQNKLINQLLKDNAII